MLKNKNVIISGSRRGIGRATVEVFARNGANVWSCARKHNEEFEQDMKIIAENYDVQIWPVYFDVTDEKKLVRDFEIENHILLDAEKQVNQKDKELRKNYSEWYMTSDRSPLVISKEINEKSNANDYADWGKFDEEIKFFYEMHHDLLPYEYNYMS